MIVEKTGRNIIEPYSQFSSFLTYSLQMILNTSLNDMREAIFQGNHCHKTNLH